MKFTILKDTLNSKLHSLSFNPVNAIKSDFHKISNQNNKKLTIQDFPEIPTIEKKEKSIPRFISVSKLNFENAEIHGGVTKDPNAKGGLQYTVIEPTLSERDKQNFEIIKKLLMTELSVSLGEIKTKKAAEIKLTRKIQQLIKKYKLEIPSKNLSKITYYAIRDFVYLGKIEPLMRDHMVEEISCDGTNIPLYIWHREYESIPTNIIFTSDKELNNFAR